MSSKTASYYSNGTLVKLTGPQAGDYYRELEKIDKLEQSGQISPEQADELEKQLRVDQAEAQATADYGPRTTSDPVVSEDGTPTGFYRNPETGDIYSTEDIEPEDLNTDNEEEPGFEQAFQEDDYNIETVDAEEVDGMMGDDDELQLLGGPDDFDLGGYGEGSDEDMAGNGDEFMSSIRSRDLPPGAETGSSVTVTASAAWKDDTDWRVMLSLPSIKTFKDAKVLQPLYNVGRLVFPLTPSIQIGYAANYGTTQPVHSNYPFLSYESSSVDDISISADWVVETQLDGRYWIASKHLLNSLTKMFFGDGEFVGAPPPVVKLYGYGDHIFPGVPVVVHSFNLTLGKDVDYVRINYDNEKYYVPSYSTWEIRLKVLYSRDTVRKFNLAEFVSGKLLNDQGKFM